MIDSSSKLQSGLLLGNMMEYGNYEQCITTKFNEIVGKYCLIKISPSLSLIEKILSFREISKKRFQKLQATVENSDFNWAVCVPASCPVEDVFRHFNQNIIELTQGLDLRVRLDKHDCATLTDQPSFGLLQYFVV